MVNQYLDSALFIAVICIMGICAFYGLQIISKYYIGEEQAILYDTITVKEITNINGEFLIDTYNNTSYISKEPFSMSIFKVNKTYNIEFCAYHGPIGNLRKSGIQGLIIGVDEV